MHVLIVDDDPLALRMTRIVVERAGYQAVGAIDAPAALRTSARVQPAIALLDIDLPQTNGYELARALRGQASIPIIFISGRSAPSDRVAALRSGGDDYLSKPYEPDELVARMGALLRRYRRRGAQQRAQLSSLTLDEVDQSVLLSDGCRRPLTPNEFRLLHYLMQHPGSALPSAKIVETLWGYQDERASNLVAVHIRRLRRKIEQDGSAPRYIKTVPGVGYQFEP